VELAADEEYLGPLIAEMPSKSAGGKWLVKPERGPRVVLFHRPEGVMAYTHSHHCWVAIAPVRGVETHQQWDAVCHDGGRAELRLANDRAMHRGDVATLTPPGDIHNHAMSWARAPAPTHSSSWVTTCTSSNGKNTTPRKGRGGSLPPVIQASRTANICPAGMSGLRLYTLEAEVPSCSEPISSDTASMRARWVNACGKFPRCSPVVVSISSA
jgi:hypothetical protein